MTRAATAITPATPGDYTLDMLVADAAGILRALGIEQSHFCGLSMGGMVGLGLLLDHPGLLKSAVIADSRHTTRPDFTEAWLQRAEAVRTGGIEAVVQSTVDRWSSAGLGGAPAGRHRPHEAHDRAHRGSRLSGLRGGAGAAELRPAAGRNRRADAADLRQRRSWRAAGEHPADARR